MYLNLVLHYCSVMKDVGKEDFLVCITTIINVTRLLLLSTLTRFTCMRAHTDTQTQTLHLPHSPYLPLHSELITGLLVWQYIDQHLEKFQLLSKKRGMIWVFSSLWHKWSIETLLKPWHLIILLSTNPLRSKSFFFRQTLMRSGPDMEMTGAGSKFSTLINVNVVLYGPIQNSVQLNISYNAVSQVAFSSLHQGWF